MFEFHSSIGLEEGTESLQVQCSFRWTTQGNVLPPSVFPNDYVQDVTEFFLLILPDGAVLCDILNWPRHLPIYC